jgi:hypothetical protein
LCASRAAYLITPRAVRRVHMLRAMNDSLKSYTRSLSQMELDLRSLVDCVRGRGRLPTGVEHDLLNTLAIVVMYKDLSVDAGDELDLTSEIEEALERGRVALMQGAPRADLRYLAVAEA